MCVYKPFEIPLRAPIRVTKTALRVRSQPWSILNGNVSSWCTTIETESALPRNTVLDRKIDVSYVETGMRAMKNETGMCFKRQVQEVRAFSLDIKTNRDTIMTDDEALCTTQVSHFTHFSKKSANIYIYPLM